MYRFDGTTLLSIEVGTLTVITVKFSPTLLNKLNLHNEYYSVSDREQTVHTVTDSFSLLLVRVQFLDLSLW